jgi:hypothetical protein
MTEKGQEIDSQFLRRLIEKSKARLKELQEIKNCPRVALEAEKAHLRKFESMLIALNN